MDPSNTSTQGKLPSWSQLETTAVMNCQLMLLQNGTVYLRPIKSSGLRLNGEHICQPPQDCVQIKDGDLIELGPQSVLHFSAGVDGIHDNSRDTMVFTSSESEDDDEDDVLLTPTLAVLNDAEILEQILKWLPVQSLKTARLVSTTFHEAVKDYFCDSTLLHIQPDCTNYLSQLGPHPNIKICYSGHPTDTIFEEDALLWLTRNGVHVRTLDLTIMPGRNDFAFLRDCLTCNLGTIEQLTLTLVSNDSDYSCKYFHSDLRQTTLTRLIINLSFDTFPEHLLIFLPCFLRMFPRTEELTVASHSEGIAEDCILREITNNSENFEFLTSVSLNSTNSDVLDLLIDFPRKLRSLNLHVDSSQSGRLQNLLDSHATSLIELRLTLQLHHHQSEPEVDLPTFPKLTTLTLNMYLDSGAEDVEEIDLLGMRNILSGSLPTIFPALTTLQMFLMPSNEGIFGQFTKSDPRVNFPQIRHFRTNSSKTFK